MEAKRSLSFDDPGAGELWTNAQPTSTAHLGAQTNNNGIVTASFSKVDSRVAQTATNNVDTFITPITISLPTSTQKSRQSSNGPINTSISESNYVATPISYTATRSVSVVSEQPTLAPHTTNQNMMTGSSNGVLSPSSSSTVRPADKNSTAGLPAMMIIGLAIAAIVVVIVCSIILLFFCRRRRQKKEATGNGPITMTKERMSMVPPPSSHRASVLSQFKSTPRGVSQIGVHTHERTASGKSDVMTDEKTSTQTTPEKPSSWKGWQFQEVTYGPSVDGAEWKQSEAPRLSQRKSSRSNSASLNILKDELQQLPDAPSRPQVVHSSRPPPLDLTKRFSQAASATDLTSPIFQQIKSPKLDIDPDLMPSLEAFMADYDNIDPAANKMGKLRERSQTVSSAKRSSSLASVPGSPSTFSLFPPKVRDSHPDVINLFFPPLHDPPQSALPPIPNRSSSYGQEFLVRRQASIVSVRSVDGARRNTNAVLRNRLSTPIHSSGSSILSGQSLEDKPREIGRINGSVLDPSRIKRIVSLKEVRATPNQDSTSLNPGKEQSAGLFNFFADSEDESVLDESESSATPRASIQNRNITTQSEIQGKSNRQRASSSTLSQSTHTEHSNMFSEESHIIDVMNRPRPQTLNLGRSGQEPSSRFTNFMSSKHQPENNAPKADTSSRHENRDEIELKPIHDPVEESPFPTVSPTQNLGGQSVSAKSLETINYQFESVPSTIKSRASDSHKSLVQPHEESLRAPQSHLSEQFESSYSSTLSLVNFYSSDQYSHSTSSPEPTVKPRIRNSNNLTIESTAVRPSSPLSLLPTPSISPMSFSTAPFFRSTTSLPMLTEPEPEAQDPDINKRNTITSQGVETVVLGAPVMKAKEFENLNPIYGQHHRRSSSDSSHDSVYQKMKHKTMSSEVDILGLSLGDRIREQEGKEAKMARDRTQHS